MKNTYWDAIEPGDVVSFIYKGQQDDSKSARRVVICLDPRYEHRKKSTNRIVDYFIGLEIFNSSKSNLTPTIIKQLFELLSENADVVLTDAQSGGRSRMERIYLEEEVFDYFLDIIPLEAGQRMKSDTPFDSVDSHRLVYVM